MSFGGDATDVPPYVDDEGGVILSATIDKFVYASLTSPTEGLDLKSDGDLGAAYNLGEQVKIYKGEQLIQAAVKRMGVEDQDLHISIHSDAPAGSGFGSTSTTVIAVMSVLKEFTNKPLDYYELAELAYKVEREDVGLLGGKQDHYMAIFGGFDYIEFVDGQAIVNKLKIKPSIANELQYSLLLCHTGKLEQSGRILKDQMDDYSDIKLKLDDLKMVTMQMKDHLLKSELGKFGKAMHEVWMIKKSLSPHISSERIDKMYDVARDAGAVGGRVLGAGGGGYLLLFCDFEKKHVIAAELEKMGGKLVNFEFEYKGLKTWRSKK